MTRAPGAAELPQPHDEAGFTLVETLVVVVLMSIAMAIAVSGFQSYARSSEHRGTRDEVVSALRAANQRALSEAAAYCVRFHADGRTWTTYRGACGTGPVVKGPEAVGGTQVSLNSVDFVTSTGVPGSRDVTFTARGTASRGSLQVRRADSAKTYTVSVEGLTARVSSS